MIKKISNWFFGSFTRSLGRSFAFFVLGLLAVALLNSNKPNLKKFVLSDLLGINYVYAYETSGYGSAQYMDVTIPVNSIGCITSTSETSSSWYNFGTEHTWGSNNKKFIKKTRALIQSGSYTWSKGNTYTIKVTLALNPKNYSNWYNGYKYMRLEGCTSTNSSTCNSSNLIENGSQFIVYNDTSSNYWVVYEITFVPQSNLKMIWIELNWGADGNTEYNSSCTGSNTAVKSGFYFVDFQWYRVDWVRYTPNNDYEVVSNAINTQTTIINNNFSQTNENINNINNSINDLQTDIMSNDLDSDEIEDLLSDSGGGAQHSFDESLTPLSGFLTLPLTWVQNLLSSSNTCSDISLPLPFLDNKYLTLPCMSSFWNRLGLLSDLISLMWIAVVGSRIFNLFFKLTVETFSTSANSYEKMIKLKEWEL